LSPSHRLRVALVTPAPPGSTSGNRVTALRWARILRDLGHRVRVIERYGGGGGFDALVALHARKSAPSVERFARDHPQAPLVVALTGTDVYRDIKRSAVARRSLELAGRLVALQPLADRELPGHLRRKVHVIRQSARRPPVTSRRADAFEVCVLAHLRAVKDPLRTARASRRLPASSRIRILHLGTALDSRLAGRARVETARNPRYRWLGARPRREALRLLARCRLLVLTSRVEGGANAVSEAIVCGVPVISSRIAGSVGLLGAGYPGYFPMGDTRALARLLARFESDRRFRAELGARCRRLRPLFSPLRERAAWRKLLDSFRTTTRPGNRAAPGPRSGRR
jgi:putative glycosyltransferase (TIGR04348 family)